MADQPGVVAWPTPYEIAGQAYGVNLRISTDTEKLMLRLRELLPPGWIPSGSDLTAGPGAARFTLITHDGIEHLLMRDDVVLARTGLEVALGVFDAQLRAYIAQNSPQHIFVHAAVVGHRSRAIAIPGPSFSGKTSLVAALVKAGAMYYSDEYAVLDDQGLVHAYPKPLSIRSDPWTSTDHDISSLGGVAGEDALPLGMIVATHYRPGAQWSPTTLSPGEGVLRLLANTIPAQDRPQETMKALQHVVDRGQPIVLEGDRGEAAAVAEDLLDRLSE